MPFHLTFDLPRKRVTLIGTGSTDTESFREAIQQVIESPSFQPGFRVLVDAQALDYTPTPEETRKFAQAHCMTESLRRSKVAVVVGKLVDYGMANMFAILCSMCDASVGSFQTLDEAEQWLAEE